MMMGSLEVLRKSVKRNAWVARYTEYIRPIPVLVRMPDGNNRHQIS